MRLSRQCAVAVDILVFCGRRPGELVRTGDAAVFANTTKGHAHQVALQLVRQGLLVGIRGRPGGIRLARQADSILLGEVVRLMEPAFREIAEPAGTRPFQALVMQAYRAAFDTLDDVSIADLC